MFLLLGFPSACRQFLPSVFFSIGFFSWALIPRCLCCVSSSVFVELKALFFFFYPLPAYLCFFSCFLLTFCKAQSKLCSSKLLLLHCTDPSSSLLSWAYVTHYNKCPAAAERLCPLFAIAQACSLSCASSVTHLTPLLAVSGINQKTILF